MKRALVLAVVTLAIPLAALAAAKSIRLPADHPYATLKPGQGAEVTRNHCVACHSADYIVTQPRGDAIQWQGVVRKMIQVYGVPISDPDAKAIVDYLSSAYGPAK